MKYYAATAGGVIRTFTTLENRNIWIAVGGGRRKTTKSESSNTGAMEQSYVAQLKYESGFAEVGK